MKPARTRPSPSQVSVGSPSGNLLVTRMNTSGMALPRCSRCSTQRPARCESRGVTSCPNVVLHAWLEAELLTNLEGLPTHQGPRRNRQLGGMGALAGGLNVKPTLCAKLPPLRLLLVMDNPQGTHHRNLRRVVVRTRRYAAVPR